MQPVKRDIAYLWDMREAANLILDFTRGETLHSFTADPKLRSAVERQLEIIGEAARRVSTEFQNAHPDIPWRNIIGLRNLLIHEYGEVKVDRVWMIVSDNIGDLVNRLDALITGQGS
jgi:uncharacterized protein with HEPN domain